MGLEFHLNSTFSFCIGKTGILRPTHQEGKVQWMRCKMGCCHRPDCTADGPKYPFTNQRLRPVFLVKTQIQIKSQTRPNKNCLNLFFNGHFFFFCKPASIKKPGMSMLTDMVTEQEKLNQQNVESLNF